MMSAVRGAVSCHVQMWSPALALRELPGLLRTLTMVYAPSPMVSRILAAMPCYKGAESWAAICVTRHCPVLHSSCPTPQSSGSPMNRPRAPNTCVTPDHEQRGLAVLDVQSGATARDPLASTTQQPAGWRLRLAEVPGKRRDPAHPCWMSGRWGTCSSSIS